MSRLYFLLCYGWSSPILLALLHYLAIVHSQSKEAIIVILKEAILPHILAAVWEKVKWLVTHCAN